MLRSQLHDCPYRPKLAVTLGDPAGIGPEVILKAWADPSLHQHCELKVVGTRRQLQQTHQAIEATSTSSLASWQDIPLLEVCLPAEQDAGIRLGQESAASGAASFAYLKTAIAHTLSGEFDGIVTGPIAKSAWNAAGHPYPGQTECLAEQAGVNRFGMLFAAQSPHIDWQLCMLLATTHVSLRQVPDLLTLELLTLKLDLLIECLQQDFGIAKPRIAIAGLNPHSGEQGQLGTEERDRLIPWLMAMRSRYPEVQLDGPIPPDTLWIKPGLAWTGAISPQQAHDGYLALYHDQGLIPIKLLAFDRAVNTTIGLPFVRTSPDHGTAFDIAGKGIAQAESLKAAIVLATRLVIQRNQNHKIRPEL